MSDVLPAIPARLHQPHPIEVRHLSPPQLEDNLPVLATSQGCTVHFLAWRSLLFLLPNGYMDDYIQSTKKKQLLPNKSRGTIRALLYII
jgi:hypothetical protein